MGLLAQGVLPISGFVASPPPGPPALDPADLVGGDAFWPAVSIAGFQAAMRIPDEVDPVRLRDALRGGMIHVRGELRSWKAAHVAVGAQSLANIMSELVDGELALELLYRRAVFHVAAAELAESHSDIAATGDARDRNEDRRDAGTELRRLATHAIRDILGTTRTAVELI